MTCIVPFFLGTLNTNKEELRDDEPVQWETERVWEQDREQSHIYADAQTAG